MPHSTLDNSVANVEYIVLVEGQASSPSGPPLEDESDLHCCRYRTPLQSPCPKCGQVRREHIHSNMN